MKNCSICKQDKEFADFNKNAKKPDGLQNVCRECSKVRSKQYYTDNTQKHKEAVRRWRGVNVTEVRQWFKEHKATLSCVECGEDRVPTLDFHHTDPATKEYTVSGMVANGNSKASIIRELNKCIVLCSNCHRMLHYELNSNGPVA